MAKTAEWPKPAAQKLGPYRIDVSFERRLFATIELSGFNRDWTVADIERLRTSLNRHLDGMIEALEKSSDKEP